MSNDVRPFAPIYRNTQYTQTGTTSTASQPGRTELSVTATTNGTTPVPVVLPGNTSLANNNFCQIQLANTTDKWAFVNFGQAGAVVAATANDYPVGPGATVIVTVPSEVTGASVVLQAAAGSLTGFIFTRGSGT